ncbi:hypothetical protein H0E87_016136 [Populus deltoides]|nr:hypothetical protein H0E87_016136 [Populus deltoides]
MLHERCTKVFKDLLAEVIIAEAAAQKTEDGKTVLDSWSTAKRLLKPDPRYNKMPRKERETLWRRYAEEMLRKQKSSPDQKEDRHTDAKNRSYGSPTIYPSYDIRGERRDPSVIRLHIIFQSFRSSRCLLDSTMIRPFKVASRIIGTKPSTRNMRGFHVAFVAPAESRPVVKGNAIICHTILRFGFAKHSDSGRGILPFRFPHCGVYSIVRTENIQKYCY